MIVRELLTLLGFTIDKASYDRASKAYDAMQGKMTQSAQATQQAAAKAQQAQKGLLGQALGMFQRFNAQAGLTNLLKQYTTLASDANETRGALTQLFGPENLAQVEKWSQVQGAAMGRSQYDLQAYAARLGSVLGPVTKSREEAQKMAQSLSELSVDLASFFNTRDEDAMAALRSGLTGEYESLKRYGIVLNDVTLQEVAAQRGIKKKITQMTTAEKTELRYAAIIERSKAAQGDAVRTSEGFANATKALKAQLKTLGTNAAKKVIPHIEALVRLARDAVNWFSKMAENSRILESAMYVLAAVAGVLALEFYGAFVLPALAVAALILVVDELWKTLEGGDTVLRDVIDSFLGVGTTAKAVEKLKAAFEGLDAVGIWESFRNGADNAGWAVERLIEKMIRLLKYTPPGLVYQGITGIGRATGLLGPEDAEGRTMGRGIDAPLAETFADELALRQRDQTAAVAAGVQQRAADRAERARAAEFGPRQFSAVPSATEAATMGGMGYGVLRAPAPDAPAGGGAPMVVVPVSTAAPTIIIQGGDPATMTRVAKQVLADDRKAQAAAAGGRGRS